MTALSAAVLASLAAWVEDRLSNEHADRQTICEDVAAQLRDMAAAVRESGDAAGIPEGYRPTIRQALADAIMFRLARAGGRDDSDQVGLYRKAARDTGLPLPEELPAAGVLLDEGQAATAAAALEDAAEYREYQASLACSDCAASPVELCEDHAAKLDAAQAYRALAAALGGAR